MSPPCQLGSICHRDPESGQGLGSPWDTTTVSHLPQAALPQRTSRVVTSHPEDCEGLRGPALTWSLDAKLRQYLKNYIVLRGAKSKQAHTYLKIRPITLLVKFHSQLDTLWLRYQRCLRYNRGPRSKLPHISFEGNAVAPIRIHLLF